MPFASLGCRMFWRSERWSLRVLQQTLIAGARNGNLGGSPYRSFDASREPALALPATIRLINTLFIYLIHVRRKSTAESPSVGNFESMDASMVMTSPVNPSATGMGRPRLIALMMSRRGPLSTATVGASTLRAL